MAALVIFIIIFPLLTLFFKLSGFSNPLIPSFFQALIQTLVIALGTTLFTLCAGVLSALGLLALRGPKRQIFEAIFILPSFLPTLFVIMSILEFGELVGWQPFGLLGVLLTNTLVYFGFFAVSLGRSMTTHFGGQIELATVEGASAWQIRLQVLKSLIPQISILSFIVFSSSFFGFNIPLIIGGHNTETIEVYIYKILYGTGDITLALSTALVQIFLLAILAFFIKEVDTRTQSQIRDTSKVGSKGALVVFIGLTIAILASSFVNLSAGIQTVMNNSDLLLRFSNAAVGSIILSICVFVMVFLTFCLLAFYFPNIILTRFLLSYIAPSSVIIGLGIYVVFDASDASFMSTYFWIAYGITISLITVLYRFKGYESLQKIETQIQCAQIMGATRAQIFSNVVLPQTTNVFLFLSGIGSLWAAGDFVVASMISTQELTLAQMGQNLLSGYRLDLAAFVICSALMIGLCLLFFSYLISNLLRREG